MSVDPAVVVVCGGHGASVFDFVCVVGGGEGNGLILCHAFWTLYFTLAVLSSYESG